MEPEPEVSESIEPEPEVLPEPEPEVLPEPEPVDPEPEPEEPEEPSNSPCEPPEGAVSSDDSLSLPDLQPAPVNPRKATALRTRANFLICIVSSAQSLTNFSGVRLASKCERSVKRIP